MLIRAAEPGDALNVARVHVRSWQVAYRDLLPRTYLDNLRPEDRAGAYDFASTDPHKPQTLVAIENAEVVGFATTSPSRDSDLPNHGELSALYVDPDWWGRGMGATLITAARSHLHKLGYQNALLWLLSGNRRAARFYEFDGWIADGKLRTELVWDVKVDEVRYQRTLS